MRARSPASGRRRAVRGVALLTLVILLTFLGSLGASLIAMVYARLIQVTLEIDRLQAQYLAEAGQAQALYEIKTGLDLFGTDGRGNIPPTALGPGYYMVTQNPDAKTLTCVGVVQNVRRVIVTKYE